MDIRTRLSLALVFVSLLSMMLLGTFAYYTSANLLQEISLRQLDALAESKKRDLIKVYDSWEDNLRLVRDRSQLRYSIRDYVDSESPEALRDIQRIVEGITAAVTEIDKIIIFDVEGKEIVSSGRSGVTHSEVPVGDDITYVGTFIQDDGPRVVLNTGVRLDGALIGGIELVIDARDIIDVTGDFTGLGETGEAFVVKKVDDKLVTLNPMRHEVEGFSGEQVEATATGDMRKVFTPDENVPAEAHKDYRGEWVWLATRYIDELGWGLVVKVDVEEEEERADVLQEALFDIAVALSAFAIIGGALLGFYLASPIQELAVVVERMRHGEAGVRAEVKGDDEIAYLAESLNEFLNHLENQREEDA
ncbi:MAG: HAMP domain-containing protein [Pseudomonadales bacterium]|nr:HAMP domain-containing protein [Pseudomonadales bacterium]MBO6595825.1 HAMP domain-containing protein [Pseudomonadales bacterium]MBO6657866.1 HAMP domain-containing protein [Pseudomonadales bacterium]MBO6702430.1 HAMP domain-containing protein [Pseudomonadales bacterium]MBO6822309.1 HAMP domain-containing protein [Pseudomonadales bacterium]